MKYLNILESAALFKDIRPDELEAMLTCNGAKTKSVQKGKFVLLTGSKPTHIGIVISGQFHILYEDFRGERSLIAIVSPGELFAEAMCCAGVSESPVTVMAKTDSTVMLLNFSRIVHLCSNACPFHTKLIENMLYLVANKNLLLQSRMEIISLKSIRSKVMRYLESFVPEQGRNIVIPLNREEMASFLCVERCALSHELSRMKNDGLIEYKKNNFILADCVRNGQESR